MPVSRFVGRQTIQSLRHIELRFPMGQGRFGSGWVWAGIATDILDILLERNSFATLKLVISIFNKRNHGLWELESDCLREITDKIVALSWKNPRFWAPGKVEVEYWVIKGMVAHRRTADPKGSTSNPLI